MTTFNAFGRLFPPALFLIVGLVMSVLWTPDPVLLAVAMCAAAASGAWLIVTAVAVARGLEVGASSSPVAPRLPGA